jgi:hypothetical protein
MDEGFAKLMEDLNIAKGKREHLQAYVDSLSESPITVEVIGARVAVKTIQAYGLTLTVDAMGDAVTISTDAGLMVIE